MLSEFLAIGDAQQGETLEEAVGGAHVLSGFLVIGAVVTCVEAEALCVELVGEAVCRRLQGSDYYPWICIVLLCTPRLRTVPTPLEGDLRQVVLVSLAGVIEGHVLTPAQVVVVSVASLTTP